MGYEFLKFIRDIEFYLKVSNTFLSIAVSSYIATIPPTELIERKLPGRFVDAIKRMNSALDEIDELQNLYDIQKERLEIDFGNEKKMKKLFKTTGNEVFIASKILELSAQLKMDMGLIKRQIGEIDINSRNASIVKHYSEYPELETLFKDPKKRERILTVLNKLQAVGLSPETIAKQLVVSQEEGQVVKQKGGQE
jgi:hypothetical protein